MIRRDTPEILAIDTASFDRPWAEEQLLEFNRQRNQIGMIVEIEEEIVGYMLYELRRDSIHLARMGVHPDYRRCGIGRQIIDKLIAKLSSGRRHRLTLDCRESNLAAQLFYRSCGLKAVGIRQGHYADTGEDAYAFEYRLPTGEG
jgi:ribosomal-protein-alanine N-acetyltransferase